MEKPKLRIGYVKHLETVSTSKPCVRALMIAVDALKENGHEVVEIKMPKLEQFYEYVSLTTTPDSRL